MYAKSKEHEENKQIKFNIWLVISFLAYDENYAFTYLWSFLGHRLMRFSRISINIS